MDEQEQLYTKGFNSGYLLARNEPEIAAALAATPNRHDPYFSGIISGREQYANEVREWLKGFSKDTPEKGDREQDKTR